VSVAAQLGDSLYLGSFAGDRLARWRIPVTSPNAHSSDTTGGEHG